MNYTKLFSSILDSSVWRLPSDIRVVWITILCMKDSRGDVRSSVIGLANRAQVSIEACEEAIRWFTAPDKHSTSTEAEGRRIETIDGGWHVINHHKYRDMESDEDRRAKDADRARRYRQRKAQSVVATETSSDDSTEDFRRGYTRETALALVDTYEAGKALPDGWSESPIVLLAFAQRGYRVDRGKIKNLRQNNAP